MLLFWQENGDQQDQESRQKYRRECMGTHGLAHMPVQQLVHRGGQPATGTGNAKNCFEGARPAWQAQQMHPNLEGSSPNKDDPFQAMFEQA